VFGYDRVMRYTRADDITGGASKAQSRRGASLQELFYGIY